MITPQTDKKYTVVHAFSGSGGCSSGFDEEGFETLAALDFDADACADLDYLLNRKVAVVVDIEKMEPVGHAADRRRPQAGRVRGDAAMQGLVAPARQGPAHVGQIREDVLPGRPLGLARAACVGRAAAADRDRERPRDVDRGPRDDGHHQARAPGVRLPVRHPHLERRQDRQPRAVARPLPLRRTQPEAVPGLPHGADRAPAPALRGRAREAPAADARQGEQVDAQAPAALGDELAADRRDPAGQGLEGPARRASSSAATRRTATTRSSAWRTGTSPRTRSPASGRGCRAVDPPSPHPVPVDYAGEPGRAARPSRATGTSASSSPSQPAHTDRGEHRVWSAPASYADPMGRAATTATPKTKRARKAPRLARRCCSAPPQRRRQRSASRPAPASTCRSPTATGGRAAASGVNAWGAPAHTVVGHTDVSNTWASTATPITFTRSWSAGRRGDRGGVDPRLNYSPRNGAYGVQDPERPSATIVGHHKHDNSPGSWADNGPGFADPRLGYRDEGDEAAGSTRAGAATGCSTPPRRRRRSAATWRSGRPRAPSPSRCRSTRARNGTPRTRTRGRRRGGRTPTASRIGSARRAPSAAARRSSTAAPRSHTLATPSRPTGSSATRPAAWSCSAPRSRIGTRFATS
jgi:hypothetical protein